MKRQEALELAKGRIPKILDWLSMSNYNRYEYCPLDSSCKVCKALFTKKRMNMASIRCPCSLYGVKYITRRIKQLAKEQGIDLRKEVKPKTETTNGT